MRPSLLLGLTLALIAGQSQAAIRCGGKLVEIGEKTFDVQGKCGKPLHQEEHDEAKYVKASGSSNHVETWRYALPGGMNYDLRFVNGVLREITSNRRS